MSAIEKIRALQAKARALQAAVDSCDGHIWRTDYVSKIPGCSGSCVCVRCGERQSWENAAKNGVFEGAKQ